MRCLDAMAKRNARIDVLSQETFDPGLLQREVFEIDRSKLVVQLGALRRAIIDSAEELKMVAIEGVFVKSLSQVLTRTSRKMQALAEDFDAVLRQVERAAGPKATPQNGRTPKPRNRRN
jgi:hypothetical protein